MIACDLCNINMVVHPPGAILGAAWVEATGGDFTFYVQGMTPGVIELARYNGPVLHLSLLGDVDQVVDHPEQGVYDIHVIGAERIIANAVERIFTAGKKYHLPYSQTYHLIADFMAYATFPPSYGVPKL